MVQLTIKVTKEILERSKMCSELKGENCAIALAVRDVFPKAWVEQRRILPIVHVTVSGLRMPEGALEIPLPGVAQCFISDFDHATPSDRVLMPELEFTVDIPDAIIDRINIDEIRPVLVNHPTLTLIEA